MSPVEHTSVTAQQPGKGSRQGPQDVPDVHIDVAGPDGSDGARILTAESVMTLKDLSVYYGDFLAAHNVDLQFGSREITALIGPSDCGKSTVLRCLNRMNDLIPGARVEGS